MQIGKVIATKKLVGNSGNILRISGSIGEDLPGDPSDNRDPDNDRGKDPCEPLPESHAASVPL